MTIAIGGSGDYGLAYDVHPEPAVDTKSAPSGPVADPVISDGDPPPLAPNAGPSSLTRLFAAPASPGVGETVPRLTAGVVLSGELSDAAGWVNRADASVTQRLNNDSKLDPSDRNTNEYDGGAVDAFLGTVSGLFGAAARVVANPGGTVRRLAHDANQVVGLFQPVQTPQMLVQHTLSVEHLFDTAVLAPMGKENQKNGPFGVLGDGTEEVLSTLAGGGLVGGLVGSGDAGAADLAGAAVGDADRAAAVKAANDTAAAGRAVPPDADGADLSRPTVEARSLAREPGRTTGPRRDSPSRGMTPNRSPKRADSTGPGAGTRHSPPAEGVPAARVPAGDLPTEGTAEASVPPPFSEATTVRLRSGDPFSLSRLLSREPDDSGGGPFDISNKGDGGASEPPGSDAPSPRNSFQRFFDRYRPKHDAAGVGSDPPSTIPGGGGIGGAEGSAGLGATSDPDASNGFYYGVGRLDGYLREDVSIYASIGPDDPAYKVLADRYRRGEGLPPIWITESESGSIRVVGEEGNRALMVARDQRLIEVPMRSAVPEQILHMTDQPDFSPLLNYPADSFFEGTVPAEALSARPGELQNYDLAGMQRYFEIRHIDTDTDPEIQELRRRLDLAETQGLPESEQLPVVTIDRHTNSLIDVIGGQRALLVALERNALIRVRSLDPVPDMTANPKFAEELTGNQQLLATDPRVLKQRALDLALDGAPWESIRAELQQTLHSYSSESFWIPLPEAKLRSLGYDPERIAQMYADAAAHRARITAQVDKVMESLSGFWDR